MKKITILLILLAFDVSAKELELKTTVSAVTVFQAGAQVTRTGITSIPSGESEIIIKDATALLKKESLQVSADGNFTILSVNHETRNEAQQINKPRITSLDAKETELIHTLEELLVAHSVYKSEEKVIMNLSTISTNSVGVTVEQIAKAQELMHLKLNQIKNEQLKLSRLITKNKEQLNLVRNELNALRIPKESVEHLIVIKVKASEETRGSIAINYIVPNARWYPTYDLRVKSIDEPLVIEYKANVSQQTGEDWKNVKLKLSTGDPSQSSVRPKVVAWWLRLNQHYQSPTQQNNYYKYTDAKINRVSGTVTDAETGEALPFCNVMVPGGSVGTATDIDGNFSLALPENCTKLFVSYIGYIDQHVSISNSHLQIALKPSVVQLNEVVVTESYSLIEKDNAVSGATVTRSEIKKMPNRSASYSTSVRGGRSSSASTPPVVEQIPNLINTEFSIADKYTILSENNITTVQIKSISTPATYQYYCAPRYDKDVFLTALLTDWNQYELLQGSANVFFEGTFVGNTLLDTKFLKDTLEISLGRDKSIVVERTKSKDFTKKQFIGNDNIATRHWDITVRNGKKQNINIIIEDQFPLTSDGRIEVKQEEKSSGKLEDNTGIITWQFDIVPSDKKKVTLKYTVKYPKGTFVGLD